MERVIKNLPLNDTVSGIKEIDGQKPPTTAKRSCVNWFLIGFAVGQAFILIQLYYFTYHPLLIAHH